MPWSGFTDFIMGRVRDDPEPPYVTYVLKHNLESRERHRRGMPPLHLMEYEEWSQSNEQAIADWQEQIVRNHNRDHKTCYRNWNDFSRATMDSAISDQNVRSSMRRPRNGQRDRHAFFDGPRNSFSETGGRYAGTIDPYGRSELDYILGLHLPDGRPTGSARRGGFGMRDTSTREKFHGTAGWKGQPERQDDGPHGPGATDGTKPDDGSYQDEAQAFLESFAGAEPAGSDHWQDEADAFLNAHPGA